MRRRMCAPVPFEGTLSLRDAMRDFELHVSGFASYALYAPGSDPGTCLRCCLRKWSFVRLLQTQCLPVTIWTGTCCFEQH